MPSKRPPITRLSRIDGIIRSGCNPTAGKLAAEVEVTRRTILRDLAYMKNELGAPLDYDRAAGGYRYTQTTWAMPLLRVTEGELIALFIAERVLRPLAGTSFAEQLSRSFARITAALGAEISFSPAAWSAAMSVRPIRPVREADARLFAAITGALHERRTLEIDYFTASRGEGGSRRIDPYHVALVGEDWQLAAFCHVRKDVRSFALHRITAVRPTTDTFVIPTDFSPAKYFAGAFRSIVGGGPPQRVVLRFDAAVAPYLRERSFHPSQSETSLPDGGLEVTMELSSLVEVRSWILSWGSMVRVIGPADLRRQVVGELQKMLDNHRGR